MSKMNLPDPRQNEENFRLLAENANDGILIGIRDGFHVYANPRVAEMTGYSIQELTRTTINDLAHPEEVEKIKARFWKRIQGKTIPRQYETRILRKNGDVLPVEITASRTLWVGEPAVLVILRDVSRRKRTEDELRQNEERFRALFDGALDAVILTSPRTGKIIDANPAASELLWLPNEEIVALHHTDIYPEELKEHVKETFSRHIQDKDQDRPMEARVLRSDGSERPVEVLAQIVQLNGVPVLHSTFRDISERKRAERELRLLSRVVAQSSEGMAVTDLDGNLLFVNKAFAEMHGYDPDQLTLKHLSAFHTSEQMHAVDKANKELLEKGSFSGEILHLHADGTIFPTLMQNAILRNEKDAPVGMIGTCRDITERKRMEDALLDSERKYRNLYTKMRDGLAAVNKSGKITEFNKTFQNMIGYDAKDIYGKTYADITPKKWHALDERILEEQVLTRGYSDLHEKEFVRKDGTVLQVELHTYLIRNEFETPAGMWTIVRDITERKKMETELLEVQKLESLALLAGGVAHDFNNILSSILVNISIVRSYGKPDEESDLILEDAEKASYRAKTLTQQLLTFARGGMPLRKTVRLNLLLTKTSDFAMSGSNTRCECSIANDLWAVEADENQIGLVIQNMLINADQAMAQGGKIQLSAENVVLGEGERFPLKGGRYIKVSIMDQGSGIPEEQRHRIFDPFFTTKKKASGLGLSTSYSIVKSHDGGIFVESSPGEGSTFLIFLPASEKSIKAKTRKKVKQRRKAGRILLVDDEELVRRSVGHLLRHLGYEMEVASDGEEGIRLYERARKRGMGFHAVILDLTIPGGMGGVEAAKKLKDMYPDARILVSSGYSNDPILSKYVEYGFSGVVVKPYRVEELEEELERIIPMAGSEPIPEP